MSQKIYQVPDWAKRPVFREKQRLTPERLNRVHEHQMQRLRMTLLGVAGSGVVYGFRIGAEKGEKPEKQNQSGKQEHCGNGDGKLPVSCGLALDCFGRQLYWPGGALELDSLCGEPPTCAGSYTLSLHYAERRVSDEAGCGCKHEQTDWVEEGVVFTLSKGCCEAACGECPDNCCKDDTCLDACDYACGHTSSTNNCIKPDACLTNVCKDVPKLCDASCGDWFYDADHGIALGCVDICDLSEKSDKCGPQLGFCAAQPEVCHTRPYVYRNPLLYELIMGCQRDLPKVEALYWKKEKLTVTNSKTLMPWQQFSELINHANLFSIRFSKPIEIATLHPVSVLLTIFMQERRTDYWEGRRVPLLIEHQSPHNGFTQGITLKIADEWIDAEVNDTRSSLMDGSIAELTIRGAMLRDQCGNMLDAAPLDYTGKNYRQEMLGDDFVVAICVGALDNDKGGKNGGNGKQQSPKQLGRNQDA
ncbi:MAG: hypothetical protein KJ914_04175 [Gammaproteobacteria bacterium]|nr:hypothetical protein [Gammaproteobacteria bacterium]MBU1723006.1 hypothetical protein [Gammaproteobacteria bacterium]MBU2003807.1 hypothetical protein [Gammaproteobacteria bacterium]